MKKNIINKVIFAGLATLAFAACSEPADEITSVNYARNFSPVNLEARVVNQTNIRLTFTPSQGATSYAIEVFNDSMQFAGSPVKTASITADQIPYTITGLEGEEFYSIRIKAITEGNDARTSNWSPVCVETGREQIFYDIAEEDLEYNNVTLRWPAGESADYITVTPGDIRHDLTASEISAGACNIDGLTSDTEYKAVMKRGEKTRGTVTFTTPLNLKGATKVEPTEDLAEVVASAEEGAVLALMPGTYAIAADAEATYENGSLKIGKSITIRSAKGSDRAIIKGRITIQDGASLDLNQVVIDASGTDGGQVFNFTTDGSYDHLNIQDCEIFGATKGFYYVNVAAAINDITINNSIIRDIICDGGDLFDCRKGYIKQVNLTNSTIWNCAKERDFFRMDDASGSFEGVTGPVYIVDHNTFVNCGNGGANKQFFYVRFVGNDLTYTNNLMTGFNNKRGFTSQANTDAEPTLANNYYWECANLISLADGNTEKVRWFDTEGKVADPNFVDAANGNFKVQNEDIIFYGIGDPRWLK